MWVALLSVFHIVAGAAATITVGTTSSLAAGQSATVLNVGSTSNAIFNFGIPQGATGMKLYSWRPYVRMRVQFFVCLRPCEKITCTHMCLYVYLSLYEKIHSNTGVFDFKYRKSVLTIVFFCARAFISRSVWNLYAVEQLSSQIILIWPLITNKL